MNKEKKELRKKLKEYKFDTGKFIVMDMKDSRAVKFNTPWRRKLYMRFHTTLNELLDAVYLASEDEALSKEDFKKLIADAEERLPKLDSGEEIINYYNGRYGY